MQDTKTYSERKQRIRQLAKNHLSEIGVNPDLLDGLECYVFDDQVAFMKKSDVPSNGLTNDIGSLPVAVLYADLSEKRFDMTDAGKLYFS